MVVPVLPSRVQGFPFLYTLKSIYLWGFNNSYLLFWDAVSRSAQSWYLHGFYLHFLMSTDVRHLFKNSGPLPILKIELHFFAFELCEFIKSYYYAFKESSMHLCNVYWFYLCTRTSLQFPLLLLPVSFMFSFSVNNNPMSPVSLTICTWVFGHPLAHEEPISSHS